MPSLDARTLRDIMSRFAEGLRTHRREIDSLNVFPVPDGDTGTNLLLTQEAVERSVAGLDGASLAEVGLEIARAALMGARGNSGVIMSQVLGGFCRRLCAEDEPDGAALAEALDAASAQAHRSVADPVEGTMLSVLAGAARAARGSALDGAPPGLVADAALRAARTSLARTPRQLPSLREAGVVDAGGKGIVLFLDAIRAAVEDIPLSEGVGPLGPVGETQAEDDAAEPASRYGFEVMYLVECEEGAVPRLRERLRAVGDSVVVVGGGGLFNVHVHTDDPGSAVEEGIEAGRPRGIRVNSLDRQVAEACLAGTARGVQAAEAADDHPQACGLVAVASGDGAVELFRDLGAAVVTGVPGNGPSEEDLAGALGSAASNALLVLPNLETLIPAAIRAAEGTGKDVVVIPTRSVPEGLAAAAAFNPRAGIAENAATGREAAARVTTIDVADDRNRSSSDGSGYVASVDGELRETGQDPLQVAVAVLRGVVEDRHEILTVLTGEAVETDAVAPAMSEAFPHLEIEVHRGGQAGHPLLIGVE